LALVAEGLRADFTIAQEEGAVDPDVISNLTALAEQLQAVLAVGATVVSRTVETAEDMRELVEKEAIDEDELFDMITRFVGMRVGQSFSVADLEDHLKNLHVEYPVGKGQLTRLLNASLADIRLELIDDKRNLVWVPEPDPKPRGKARVYLIAEVIRRRQPAVETILLPDGDGADDADDSSDSGAGLVGDAVDSQAGDEASGEVELSADATVALEVYTRHPKFSAAKLYAQLTSKGMDESQAVSAFRELVDAGKLFKFRRDGKTQFATEPQESAPKRKGGQQEADGNGHEKQLNPEQKAKAKIIIAAIAEQRNPEKPYEPREILNMLIAAGEEGFNEEIIKAIGRALDRQGIFVLSQSRQGRTRARAARHTVMKFRIASPQLARDYKFDQAPIDEIIDKDGRYETAQ
jgi:hypothetical protein